MLFRHKGRKKQSGTEGKSEKCISVDIEQSGYYESHIYDRIKDASKMVENAIEILKQKGKYKECILIRRVVG